LEERGVRGERRLMTAESWAAIEVEKEDPDIEASEAMKS